MLILPEADVKYSRLRKTHKPTKPPKTKEKKTLQAALSVWPECPKPVMGAPALLLRQPCPAPLCPLPSPGDREPPDTGTPVLRCYNDVSL